VFVCDVNCINLAQNKAQRRALVNTVTDIQVHKTLGPS
jgi:hypothetical protein